MDTMCESAVHCTRRGVFVPEEPLAPGVLPDDLWAEGRAGALLWPPVTSAGECVFDGLREPPADAVPNGSSGIDMMLSNRTRSLLDVQYDADDRSQRWAGWIFG
jgi:hypothetical protein